ncbi:helix-turn-helix domain-containing protein [Burkholderia stagnalis]
MDTVPVFKSSTLDLPEPDRFHLWMEGSHCECRLRDEQAASFAMESSAATLGPLILAGRRWLPQEGSVTYEMRRTERLIRTDGQDFFYLMLLLGGRNLFRSENVQVCQEAGDLCLSDAAQSHEYEIRPGDRISLVVPRDFLPHGAENLHGRALSGGMGRLLGDHMLSLFRNLPDLRQQDVPHVVQSTLQLATAAVSPTADTLREAERPIRDALRSRLLRYIEAHLLDHDLTPDRICRDIGLSRAKLYQLFEDSGGVMRQIQRKRLRRAYHALADLGRPRPRIAEIAWRHGFSDEKYFHRLFKAEFGHTPGETLERVRHSSGNPSAGRPDQADHPPGWNVAWGVPR